jgi:hypothetical protein
MWMETSLNDNPDAILVSWEVFEVTIDDGVSRHFIGDDLLTQLPRVSSPILWYDSEKMLGKTRYNTIFRLKGNPSYKPGAAKAIHDWLVSGGFQCDKVEIISNNIISQQA